MSPTTPLCLSRRAFLGGTFAAFGGSLLPSDIFAADGRPIMTFGVLSDIHIGGRRSAAVRLETALRWLDARGADAVLSPGDIAHSGCISQMERFASVWHKVFPNGRAGDGRKVELMISTGNHDAWDMGWPNASEERRQKDWLIYRDNPARTWERLFGEKWELVWRKEVKGITFVGAQWPSLKPDLEGYMRANAKTFDPSLPFFYCQHEHPLGTCHGSYGCGYDQGQSVRALSPFPNAVAFTGHSHCTIADERSVWQGAFTSIGAGCLHEGGLAFGAANCSAFWHPSIKTNLMAPLNDPDKWGGDPDGGCFEFVEVYADHIVVHRRSSVRDLAIGPSWVIPIPARKEGKYDFAKRRAVRKAPEFSASAVVKAELCLKGHALESEVRRGEPCVAVTFPPAQAKDGCRVFEYEIVATCAGKKVKSDILYAAGFSLPPEMAERGETYLCALKDLPKGQSVAFSVTPIECFGHRGRTFVSAPLAIPS